MFAVYCLTLLLLVYIAPALAVYPKLLLSSRTVVATPFISIAVVCVIQAALAASGTYTHIMVIVCCAALLLIAVARIAPMYKTRSALLWDWPNTHRLLLTCCIFLGIYWAAQTGSTGFDTDDEIYSWNMWAIQHYQNAPTDYYYTGVYPQLFAILISFCYQLLGNIELQLPVKAMFAIFPVALWGAIAVAAPTVSASNAAKSITLALVLFAAIGSFFGVGLADPLMASALVVSIFLFMQYAQQPSRFELLVLSITCAAVALYTKQAALVWALASFPLIALLGTLQRRLPPAVLIGAAALLATGLFWALIIGHGFQNNGGVIAASQEGRSTVEQLLFAVKKFCIEQPLLPVLLLAAVYSAVKSRQRDILILFLLPSLVLWLLYGAYSLRLGIHVIALAALLIAASDYTLPGVLAKNFPAKGEWWLRRSAVAFIVLAAISTISASVYRINKNTKVYGNQFSLDLAGKNTIAKFWGRDAEFVFNELYDKPNLLLWVPVNYIYGVFYGHTPMMRPDLHQFPKYNVAMLLDDIQLRRPTYLFDGGQWVDYTPASGLLRELAEQKCTYLFERVLKRNKYGYVLYRLQNNDVLFEQCRVNLQSPPPASP